VDYKKIFKELEQQKEDTAIKIAEMLKVYPPIVRGEILRRTASLIQTFGLTED